LQFKSITPPNDVKPLLCRVLHIGEKFLTGH
jgi:hypothetical protein